MGVVEKMKDLRARQELSQEELGVVLGKSLATIHLYETRKRVVPKSVEFMVDSLHGSLPPVQPDAQAAAS